LPRTTFRPHFLDGDWTVFGPCSDHVWTMFAPCLDHVWTMFGQCFTVPLVLVEINKNVFVYMQWHSTTSSGGSSISSSSIIIIRYGSSGRIIIISLVCFLSVYSPLCFSLFRYQFLCKGIGSRSSRQQWQAATA
jgi:hypothetical protein